MGFGIEYNKVSGEEKHAEREFLRYELECPLFSDSDTGSAKELNGFLKRLIAECREGISGVLLPRLVSGFETLSIYEQKFKFKPYRYKLEISASEQQSDVLRIQIKATLSQNGKCISKGQVLEFWNVRFGCLCEKQ